TPTLSVEGLQDSTASPPSDDWLGRPGLPGGIVSVADTRNVNATDAVSAPPSAVTVTDQLSPAVGGPLIRPLVALIVRPVGKPVARNVRLSPSGSLALIARLTD